MVATLQSIKNRIRAIENAKKVTSAMQMISAAKLNQAQRVLSRQADFSRGLERILIHLIEGTDGITHDLLTPHAGGKICLCVIVSDSGLCGAYNHNILDAIGHFLAEHGKENVFVVGVGKKTAPFFKRQAVPVEKNFYGLHGRIQAAQSDEICRLLTDLYLQGRAREVYIAYTRYGSKVFHKPVIEKFLNLEFRALQASPGIRQDEFLFEPDPPGILEELLPRYLSARFGLILLEAFAAEHSSRAMAMKTATDNAKDLLEFLVLTRNKLRQANITKGIIEIVSSVEALGR